MPMVVTKTLQCNELDRTESQSQPISLLLIVLVGDLAGTFDDALSASAVLWAAAGLG